MERFLSLCFPILFTFGGVWSVVIALIGSPKFFEESDNPNMQRQIERLGKTKTRILHAAGGLVLLAFGLYLLRGWLFVPQ